MLVDISLQELSELLTHLGTLSFGVLIVLGVALLILKFFVPAYLAEKGKNLATREDIAGITREIERIRSEYARQLQELAHQNTLLIEEFKSRSQLRLAAAERRLEAHQQAFVLWRKLIRSVHGDHQRAVVNECHTWWEQNCIYLSAEARDAFSDAAWAAHMHPSLLQDRRNPDAVTQNWDKIMNAGTKIVEGAELPALGQREALTPGEAPPAANPGLPWSPEAQH